jgi:type IV secretion system protein VirB6
MYGIGTIFSMALLSVVASMVLDLTVKISEALWGAKIVNSILGNSTEGLTSTAMQQGGIGLLLSILVVSVPPMAAMFFQGTLGSALTYSVFTPTGGRPGPQGQPAGSWAGQGASTAAIQSDRQNQAVGGTLHNNSGRYITANAPAPAGEGMKYGSPNRENQ